MYRSGLNALLSCCSFSRNKIHMAEKLRVPVPGLSWVLVERRTRSHLAEHLVKLMTNSPYICSSIWNKTASTSDWQKKGSACKEFRTHQDYNVIHCLGVNVISCGSSKISHRLNNTHWIATANSDIHLPVLATYMYLWSHMGNKTWNDTVEMSVCNIFRLPLQEARPAGMPLYFLFLRFFFQNGKQLPGFFVEDSAGSTVIRQKGSDIRCSSAQMARGLRRSLAETSWSLK